MACFRDHSPITNRQKPSKTQVTTKRLRAAAAARRTAQTAADAHGGWAISRTAKPFSGL